MGAEVELPLDPAPHSHPDASPEWRREANRRLAVHRARRGARADLQGALPGMEDRAEAEEAPSGKKSVADRVAARYAKAPTYSEMLAAEARNAARAAEAAAVAAGEARDAAQAILEGLDMDESGDEYGDPAPATKHAPTKHAPMPGESRMSAATARESSNAAAKTPPSKAQSARVETSVSARAEARPAIFEADADDSEESDSAALLEEEPIAPIQPLPAKLLEFPRELVAARKARPRLAEGPLREEYDREAARTQLRIFEVEPEAISTAPTVEPVLPEWSPLRLDSHPAPAPSRSEPDMDPRRNEAPSSDFELPLQTASLEDRLMAGVVDASLIAAGFLAFVLVFVACTVHPPVGKPALVGAGAALCAFAAIYHLLFFNFGTDTPGMRYAKIALCTFDDENPTRRTMRRRLAALLLSAIPFGLGILWAFFDDDRLGWHDRISRTYQRSYR